MVVVSAEVRRGPASGGRRGPERRVVTVRRVVVAAEVGMVRLGFATALSRLGELSGLELAAEACSVADLRRLVVQVNSRVVVLDPALPGPGGIEETVRWLLAHRQRVLVFGGADAESAFARAVGAGAHGVSRTSEPVAETVLKLRTVAAGGCAVPDDFLRQPPMSELEPPAALSAREREVLALYADGEEIASIARQLFLTENSVKEYLRRLRAKYAEAGRPAPTRLHLLRRAVEDRILPPVLPL